MSGAGAGTCRRHEVLVRARFDDRTPGGGSFQLTGPLAELVARTPDQVAPVLRAAENAARGGHWVAGFVTYEASAGLDHTLATVGWPVDHPLAGLPLAWFGVFERRTELPTSVPPIAARSASTWTLDRDEAWHARAIDTIRCGIAAGDFYQVNLTARLTGSIDDVDSTYRALLDAQGGAHHALIVTGEHAVASASPELFFSRDGDHLVTRPMKGTAERGRWVEEDEAARRALRGSAKERAENVMIVDLIRNDLARIARTGSVIVTSLLDVHRFPTVWQLTSTVEATARPGTDLADLFGALFPSGSVTGAPKGAAMAAIARLEGRPRGVYCGAVGYLAPHSVHPPVRFNVAIRTATRTLDTGYAEYGAGGAITHSSDPRAEWAELHAKAAVLAHRAQPDELIETMRLQPPGRLVNLDAHLDRITGSAGYFGFRWNREEVAAALHQAVADRREPARVRLAMHRSGDIQVTVAELPRCAGPVRIGLAAAPVDSRDVMLFHKHGDRRRYDRHRWVRPDCEDVMLWNERREITESTIANLAVRLGGRWWTPPVSSGLLPGVERARLLAAGRLTERVITIDDLPAAQGIALVSSLRGWRPAVLLPSLPRDGHRVAVALPT